MRILKLKRGLHDSFYFETVAVLCGSFVECVFGELPRNIELAFSEKAFAGSREATYFAIGTYDGPVIKFPDLYDGLPRPLYPYLKECLQAMAKEEKKVTIYWRLTNEDVSTA